VGVVDAEPLLDLAYDEDSRAEVDMNIIRTSDGRFIELQGTAEQEPFSRTILDALLSLGDRGVAQLIEKQREVVGTLVK
jgi:ribonuclease PH